MFATLGFAALPRVPADMAPAFKALHQSLDGWKGIGDLAAGMHRQGFDLDLAQYADEGTASLRELLQTARLEAQAGAMDAAQVERLIFRAAAPIVHSVEPLTEVQRGELLPNIVRVMLAAFLEEQAR